MAEREPMIIASENLQRFRRAEQGGHRAFVERAKRNDLYYEGLQWSDADKKKLDDLGRPALTLNLILSTVNAIIGEQLDRKVEPLFRAAEAGYEQTAFALNKITRGILDSADFDATEEAVFLDGIITGRGFYDIRLSFENNVQGEVDISVEDPIDVVIDAEAKEADPSTWSEVFISRWLTLDEIEVEYGKEKADALRSLSDNSTYVHGDNFDYLGRTFGDGESPSDGAGAYDEESRGSLRRIRVIERQYYVLNKQMCYVDLRTGAIRPVPYGTDRGAAIKFVEQNSSFSLVERPMRRVRMTVSADCVLLHDDWSHYRSFTIVPFFPYFRRGRPFSPVDNLIDPQNLLNKTSSQELHIVNTTANSGWLVQDGSLVDMDSEELEEHGSGSGVVITYKRGFEKPEKITPNTVPTGIDRISQKAANTIREVSSVNASMLGTTRADQSGVAQEKSIARGQVQISVVLSSLRKARVYVLRKILELVQDFYTETRYFTMVGDSVISGYSEDGVAINVEQEDGNILNDVTTGTYHIDIGYRPAGGSVSDIEFEEIMRLRELGVAIPDYVMVQYSNLTKRGEIAEFLKQSQGFGELSDEEQQLQQFQIEHQIQMLQKEIEQAEADIALAEATAKEKVANATSLTDYNVMALEMRKLEEHRDLKQKELSLRIALAARSHQSQSNLNDKRIRSQVAMKAMDMTKNSNSKQRGTNGKEQR